LDGFPTTESSNGQRQCPHCRRKWSFKNLTKEWDVAREFCHGTTRSIAAARTGMEAHAVGRLYRRLAATIVVVAANEIRLREYSFKDAEKANIEIAKLQRAREGKMRDERISQIYLNEMAIEARYELLFRYVFKERVRKIATPALRTSLIKKLPISV
jgi:hypothetical protein